MSSRVYLIRHAETARPNVFHGQESDIDLGAKGYAQAEAAAPIIAGYRPDVLVSSNMLRARRTAEPIARLTGLPHLIEPDMHERRVGPLSGTPTAGSWRAWPETLSRWISGETNYTTEGAESFDELTNRLIPIWTRITGEFAGKSIAIIAHGIVIRVILLNILEGYNVADWPKLGSIRNVSVSEVTGSGRQWRAVRMGEVPEEVRRLDETFEIRSPEIPHST